LALLAKPDFFVVPDSAVVGDVELVQRFSDTSIHRRGAMMVREFCWV